MFYNDRKCKKRKITNRTNRTKATREKYRKNAVDDGSTALIFTYKLITKNSDIY